MQYLLDKHKLKFTLVDMAVMPKEARDAVYDAADSHNLPLLFADNAFVGEYDLLLRMEEVNALDYVLGNFKPEEETEKDTEAEDKLEAEHLEKLAELEKEEGLDELLSFVDNAPSEESGLEQQDDQEQQDNQGEE